MACLALLACLGLAWAVHDPLLCWQSSLAGTEPISISEPAWAEGNYANEAYREALDDTEKQAYDIMEEAMRGMRLACVLPWGLSMDQAGEVFHAVLYDNPDIFWLSTCYICPPTPNGVYSFHFLYLFPPYDPGSVQERHDEYVELAAEMVAEMESDFDERNGGELDRARRLYDLVCEELEYEHGPHDQTILGFFDGTHKTVCAGYATTYKMLCDAAGLESVAVHGLIYGKQGTSHLWNMVRADGRVYYVDPTYGDAHVEGRGGDNYWFTLRRSWFSSHESDELAQRLPIYADAMSAEEPRIDPSSPIAKVLWDGLLDIDIIGSRCGSLTSLRKTDVDELDEWHRMLYDMGQKVARGVREVLGLGFCGEAGSDEKAVAGAGKRANTPVSR